MNLILQAVKSLFDGVKGAIEQTATALGKRIDKAQSTANTASADAKKAQATADESTVIVNKDETVEQRVKLGVSGSANDVGRVFLGEGGYLSVNCGRQVILDSIALSTNEERTAYAKLAAGDSMESSVPHVDLPHRLVDFVGTFSPTPCASTAMTLSCDNSSVARGVLLDSNGWLIAIVRTCSATATEDGTDPVTITRLL